MPATTEVTRLSQLSKDELAKALQPHYDEFVSQLSDFQKSNISFDQVAHEAYRRLQNAGVAKIDISEIEPLNKAGVPPCVLAIGTVVADAFGVFFQLLGINESETRAATRAILEELGQDTIRGLLATVHDIKNADSIVEKAKLIWSLISQVKNAIGLSGIIKALKDSMHWYDWVITGVTAVAQLTAWFATDGLAFIAEVALEGAAIAQMVEDSVNAVNVCG